MITTIKQTNMSIMSHNYHFVCVCVVRILEIYSFSKLQVYNILLLTIVTMLYIMWSKLTHLTSESLYRLINLSPLSASTMLVTTILYSLLLSSTSGFEESTCKWDYVVSVCVWFISLSWMSSRFILVIENGRISSF